VVGHWPKKKEKKNERKQKEKEIKLDFLVIFPWKI